MLNKASINDDGHQQVIIGDILLHSGSKITTIQVVIHSLPTTTPSLTLDKSIIHRPSQTPSGANGSQTIVPCDLTNTPPKKETQERTKSLSSKKLMRMQKAGVALVKELKSKVVASNQTESKTTTVYTNNNDEGTQF